MGEERGSFPVFLVILCKRDSMTKKAKFREVAPVNKLSIPEFILLAAFSINNRGREGTFEALLKECFLMSPQTFCFPKNSQWPDARKIDRPLRTLRRKALIKGSPDTSFSLTKEGRKIAGDLAKVLRQKKLFK